jgi:hypothetical protein
MKRLKKVGCGIVVFLLVAIVAAVMVGNYILKNKLADILQKAVIPAAEAKLQVDLDIAGASVNLFGGSVEFTGVKVGNPEGFEEPAMFTLERAAVDVAIMKAIKEQIYEIAEVEIKDAELTIVKNADGLVNLKVLADTLSGGEKAEKPEEKPAEKPEETPEEKPAKEGPTELPQAVLKSLAINKTINYIDHKSKQNISIKAAIAIKNLSTFETEELNGGTILITGSLAGNTEVCKTHLEGNISPITDPMAMTFDLAGDIGNLDLSFVQPYLILAGIGSCQTAALKVNLVCNDGVFDDKVSQFGLELSNVVFSKPIAGLQGLPVLILPLGVSGTLAEPKVDGVADVLVKAVTQSASKNIGALVTGGLGGLIGGKKDGDGGQKVDPASMIKVPGGDEKSGNPLGGILKKDDAPAAGEEKKSPADDLKKKIKLPF